MRKLTVYIADDQTLFRKGISRLLKSFPRVAQVKEAENGKQMLDLIKDEAPDVVMLDLDMPVMDGREAAEKIVRRYPAVKIIILSMHEDDQSVYELMELGVHAFLAKNTDPEELEKAIWAVIKNDFYHNQMVVSALRNGVVKRNKAKHKPLFDNKVPLSIREKEILLLICRELTAKEISEELSLSEKTVNNHRARMLDKIGARNTVGLVKYAYEMGLL